MVDDKARELLRTLEALAANKRYRKLDYFQPYPKQQQFFDLGADHDERLLMAGNQQGKTEAGAAETAYHLTGEYPDDWMGRRWDRPVKGWAAGETSLVVRDVQQKKLCGEPGVADAFGSGYIPRESFVDKPSLARGVTDAYDTVQVQHKTNGVVDGTSILRFKSYEQGRQKFQGETLDFIWFDEEPEIGIYSEGLTRMSSTKGIAYMTFTPLKGRSDVVIRFMDEPSPDRAIVNMTIDDALHYTEEERARTVAKFLPHEREARARGIPLLGSGRIFEVLEDQISEPPLEYIPPTWYAMWAIDFGIGHPFAAVLGLWDKDNDVIHIHQAIRMAEGRARDHAAAMKPIGRMVPVAWPQDGTAREKLSGTVIATGYKNEGLRMLPEPAMWPEGGNSTEAGIKEMTDRFTTNRLKVSKQLTEWFEEYRFYHRKDGLIVKVKDDLMSATRIFVMARRFARQVALGGAEYRRSRGSNEAKDIDFDVFE